MNCILKTFGCQNYEIYLGFFKCFVSTRFGVKKRCHNRRAVCVMIKEACRRHRAKRVGIQNGCHKHSTSVAPRASWFGERVTDVVPHASWLRRRVVVVPTSFYLLHTQLKLRSDNLEMKVLHWGEMNRMPKFWISWCLWFFYKQNLS